MGEAAMIRIAVAIAIASIAPAKAASVKELYDDCTSDKIYRLSYCYGLLYATGYAMFSLGRDEINRQRLPKGVACSQGGRFVGTDAITQAFKNWAISHPQNWSDVDAEGAANAINSTWPCP